MVDLVELKAQIRAILLALGRSATESEFRNEYNEIEGKSFDEVLEKLKYRSLKSFFKKIPDVVKISYNSDGELFIQRISNEETKHMDHLTTSKKKIFGSRDFGPQRRPRPRSQRFRPEKHSLHVSHLSRNILHRPARLRLQSVIQKIPAKPIIQSVTKKIQAKPTLPNGPIHPSHGSERVVYKKTERVIYDGDNEKAVQVKQSNMWTEVVETSAEPTLPNGPIHPSHGSERVVYNQTERVIYDGDNEKAVQVKQSNMWTEVVETSAVITSNSPSEHENSIIVISSDDECDEPRNYSKTQLNTVENLYSLFIISHEYKIPLPKMLNSPKFFWIKILSIEAPDKFSFHYDFEFLETFYKAMKLFYDKIATDNYMVKNLAVDLVVAVKHREKWFRAQIKSFNETTANIIPVDCRLNETRTIEINRKNIFYLHREFAKVPQKSAYGRIYGISPVNNEWSDEVIELVQKLKTKRHRATIKLFKDNVYHLSIISNEEDASFGELSQRGLIKLDLERFFLPVKDFCMSLEQQLETN